MALCKTFEKFNGKKFTHKHARKIYACIRTTVLIGNLKILTFLIHGTLEIFIKEYSKHYIRGNSHFYLKFKLLFNFQM